MEFIELRSGNKIMIIGFGIKGLVSDGNAVKEKLNEFKPEAIFMGISPEEVEGLKNFIDDPFEIDMSDYELIYGTLLSKFGAVEVPPPIFTQTVIYAKENDIPVNGLDVDEETFGTRYEEEYTVSQMVGYITKKRKLKKRNFDMETPEKFVMQWKHEIDKTKAMRNMEKMREEAISENLYRLFKEGGKTRYFTIVEYEFSHEIRKKSTHV